MKTILIAMLFLVSFGTFAQDETLPQKHEQGVFQCEVQKYNMVGDEPIKDVLLHGNLVVKEDGSISYLFSIYNGKFAKFEPGIDSPTSASSIKPESGMKKIIRKRHDDQLNYFFFTSLTDNVYVINMQRCVKM